MQKGRLEAFSDGVLAIILTIRVLELKVPHGDNLAALRPLRPVFPSFVYVGIYWNNHHHLLSSTPRINGAIMWTNLYLLFWLSLLPFVTGWMGENHFAPATLATYGAVLLMASLAGAKWFSRIIALDGPASVLAYAIGKDVKGLFSPPLYCAGIAASFWNVWVAGAVYVFVALMWLVPDQRSERTLAVRKPE